MGEFSLSHILLFAIVLLIFFGPSRLPALGQSIGKAIRGFKQGMTELDAEVKPVQEARQQLPQATAAPAGTQTQAQRETQPQA